MNRWYSPRGARRGMLLAAIGAACWVSWAFGHATATPTQTEACSCHTPIETGAAAGAAGFARPETRL